MSKINGLAPAAVVAAVILSLSACGAAPSVGNDLVVISTPAVTPADGGAAAQRHADAVARHKRAVERHKAAVARRKSAALAHRRAVRAHEQYLAQQKQQRQEAPPTVYPGAFCSTPGAHGTGANGNTYTCKGPGKERWRR